MNSRRRSNVWKDIDSPFGGYSFGTPEVRDEDFSYVTSDEVCGHGRRLRPQDSRKQPEPDPDDDEEQPDVVVLKHCLDTFLLQFPAFTIGEGALSIGDIRRATGNVLDVTRLRRVKLIYKGRLLKNDNAPAKSVGLKHNSTIMCVVLEDFGPDEDSSSFSECEYSPYRAAYEAELRNRVANARRHRPPKRLSPLVERLYEGKPESSSPAERPQQSQQSNLPRRRRPRSNHTSPPRLPRRCGAGVESTSSVELPPRSQQPSPRINIGLWPKGTCGLNNNLYRDESESSSSTDPAPRSRRPSSPKNKKPSSKRRSHRDKRRYRNESESSSTAESPARSPLRTRSPSPPGGSPRNKGGYGNESGSSLPAGFPAQSPPRKRSPSPPWRNPWNGGGYGNEGGSSSPTEPPAQSKPPRKRSPSRPRNPLDNRRYGSDSRYSSPVELPSQPSSPLPRRQVPPSQPPDPSEPPPTRQQPSSPPSAPGASAPIPAAPIPTPSPPFNSSQTPLEQIQVIADYLEDVLRPFCAQFIMQPPQDPRARKLEHARVIETVMAQGILRLDAIERDGDAVVGQRRKTVIKHLQGLLRGVDEAAEMK
ncbi:hypothetical protein PRK78_000689 [Emydomyces testavorans]|uniref:BAG domain-containing protein n=1 Tax=Emydomyces testavorans TaxID=2070801 RepID=A0AAF0DBL5_9EURO|nr:hypothetical protein PRK78_000689 [Emydomyces testavorans]